VNGEKVGRTGKVVRYKKFAVRLNGTSDKPWESLRIFKKVNDVITVVKNDKSNINIFELFPNIQFYDYTKIDRRMIKNTYSNYHLTFSRSETNDKVSLNMLNKGFNVAYVFGVKKEQDLPKTYKGFKVINGDLSDLRFLDEPNVIVGLKYKLMTGKGTKGVNKDNIDNNDFLINVSETLEV
jgi:hypothetical protein